MDDLVDGRLPPLIDIGANLSDPAFDKVISQYYPATGVFLSTCTKFMGWIKKGEAICRIGTLSCREHQMQAWWPLWSPAAQ
jgi:hypothetical protein